MQLCCKAPTPILQRMCYGDPVWPGVLWGVGVRGSHKNVRERMSQRLSLMERKLACPPPKHATRSGHRVGTAFQLPLHELRPSALNCELARGGVGNEHTLNPSDEAGGGALRWCSSRGAVMEAAAVWTAFGGRLEQRLRGMLFGLGVVRSRSWASLFVVAACAGLRHPAEELRLPCLRPCPDAPATAALRRRAAALDCAGLSSRCPCSGCARGVAAVAVACVWVVPAPSR